MLYFNFISWEKHFFLKKEENVLTGIIRNDTMLSNKKQSSYIENEEV